eukprot:Awhi_evm1s15718
MDDYSFVAQKELNEKNVLDVILDPTLQNLLLDFATEQLCQENILFLIDATKICTVDIVQIYDQLTNEVCRPEGEVLISEVQHIIDTYIVPSSTYEINLSHHTKNELMARFEKMKTSQSVVESGNITRKSVALILERAIVDIALLVFTNLFENFLASPKVVHYMNKRKKESQINLKLATLGLYKDQTSSIEPTLTALADEKGDPISQTDIVSTNSLFLEVGEFND